MGYPDSYSSHPICSISHSNILPLLRMCARVIIMEPTCSAPLPLLGLYDSVCPSLHCTPYENKIGGFPVGTVVF